MDDIKIFSIIKKAYLSDKATLLNKEKNGISKLVLVVEKNSNKHLIKKATSVLFGVEVVSVNIINILGKNKLSQRRFLYKENDYKKAIVTIKFDIKKSNNQINASIDKNKIYDSYDKSVDNFISSNTEN